MRRSFREKVLDYRFFHPAKLFGGTWFLWTTLIWFSVFLAISIVFPPVESGQEERFFVYNPMAKEYRMMEFISMPGPLPQRTRIYQLCGSVPDESKPWVKSSPISTPIPFKVVGHSLNYPYWMMEVVIAGSVISACIIKLTSNKKLHNP